MCNILAFFVDVVFVVVDMLIVVGNFLLGKYGKVAIPLGTIMCVPTVGAGVG